MFGETLLCSILVCVTKEKRLQMIFWEVFFNLCFSISGLTPFLSLCIYIVIFFIAYNVDWKKTRYSVSMIKECSRLDKEFGFCLHFAHNLHSFHWPRWNLRFYEEIRFQFELYKVLYQLSHSNTYTEIDRYIYISTWWWLKKRKHTKIKVVTSKNEHRKKQTFKRFTFTCFGCHEWWRLFHFIYRSQWRTHHFRGGLFLFLLVWHSQKKKHAICMNDNKSISYYTNSMFTVQCIYIFINIVGCQPVFSLSLGTLFCIT